MTAMQTEPALWSAVEAAAAIRAKRVSSRELVEACLARIARWQERLNCFIGLEADEALKAADSADADLARGAIRGALHGVPMAHKDMYYRRGKITTCGSKIQRSFVAATDSTALARLAGAGAIQLGTLNMAEFAFGPTGHNYHFGHCGNAWNPAHITGGSSSGSASGVAARLFYGALGSDTGGSIRMPALFCGVVGLKPTYGRISRAGAMPLSFTMDTVGPLVRSVADAARLMKIMAGYDPTDSTCSAEPVPDYEAALGRPIKGMKIGVPTSYFYDGIADDMGKAVRASLEVLRAQGAEIVESALPDMEAINALGVLVTLVEAATYHATWMRTRPQDYSDQVRARLESGFAVPGVQYLEALRSRGPVLKNFVEMVFSKVDVLHCPAVNAAAPRIDATDFGGNPAMGKAFAQFTRCARPFNYLGLPTLSLPCGFSEAGLPLGFQLVGRPFAEETLFAVGHAYQEATDWHTKVPAG